jgi:hypothetical protein
MQRGRYARSIATPPLHHGHCRNGRTRDRVTIAPELIFRQFPLSRLRSRRGGLRLFAPRSQTQVEAALPLSAAIGRRVPFLGRQCDPPWRGRVWLVTSAMVVLGTVGAIPASGHQQAPMPSKIVQADHHKHGSTPGAKRRAAAREAIIPSVPLPVKRPAAASLPPDVASDRTGATA